MQEDNINQISNYYEKSVFKTMLSKQSEITRYRKYHKRKKNSKNKAV